MKKIENITLLFWAVLVLFVSTIADYSNREPANEPTNEKETDNTPDLPQADNASSSLEVSLESAPSPQSSVELVIVGQLVNINHPPHCGYFHFGALAKYSNLIVLSGEYSNDTIFVVHGCPELKRSEYATGSGDLEEFRVGEYHELHLTTQSVRNIVIYEDIAYSEGSMYFSKVVNLHPNLGTVTSPK